ncbi:mitochondrial import inner membrane translocase subunit Tim17/Tim22/Tim23 family protein isoform X2 [Wolffia australiana]
MPREEDTPCASLAVESVIRLGGAGLSWGFFYGPYEADRKGIAAGTFSATSCRAQRYRMKKDRINSSIAGAVTGAALALRTRSLKQIVGTASAISALATVADFSTA